MDRIERNSFDSSFKSSYSYIYYYFTLQLGTFVIICDFFLFHIEIQGKGGWIIGGAKGYVGPPPLKLAPPGPPPSSYAYEKRMADCTHCSAVWERHKRGELPPTSPI